jgi:hypothetical protein
MTIEVFITNVTMHEHANMLVAQISKSFRGYSANFDLDDCDKVLRVKNTNGTVQPALIIDLLRDFGFSASVLQDIVTQPSRLEKPLRFTYN